MSETIELLQALIRNRCVNDGSRESGFESRSVETLREFLGVPGVVFEPSEGRQSLVYRVEGSDPDHPSLAMAPHLDVVPADPSGWSADPWAAEVVGGWVYGRGALDMLNLTAAMAEAVRPYLVGEKEPRGDLVFCATADEEAGGRYGAKYLVDDHWDLVGTDYLLTEVAYPGLPAEGHNRVPVSVGEKGALWSTLRTTGSPTHGSAPYGTDNAIAKLAQALVGIGSDPSPADIEPLWPRFVEALGLDESVSGRLTDVETLDDAISELAATDPNLARYVHAATHLTVSANLIDGGSKANVVAGEASAVVDIRSLPGMDRSFAESYLRKAMASAADHVQIEPIFDGEPNTSEVKTPLWEAIASSVEELEGHRDLVPTTMTVSTDARFWREKGTVAYGVGLFGDDLAFSEMLALFHGRDERVPVEAVHRTAQLYQLVLASFLGQ